MNKTADISPKEARRIHKMFSRVQQQYEKMAAKAFYSAIKDQVRQFIEAAMDYPTGLEMQAVNEINPLNLAKTIRRVALKVGAGYAKITEAEMTAEESGQKNFYGQPKRGLGHIMEVDWNQHPYKTKANGTDYRQLIEAYLRLYGAKKVTGITETTRKWIVEQIVKGNQAGITFDQVARNLINDQINASRALRIARTESVAMMNLGRYLAANNSNFEKEKIWVDAHDDKVRPSGTDSVYDHHAAGIRVARKLNMLFKVSGEYLMFPGDTAHGASSGNVVNCRCTFALRTKRDDQGRMITKPRPMIITETGVENFPEEATPVDISAPVTIVDFITALMNGATLGWLLGLSFLDLFNNKP